MDMHSQSALTPGTLLLGVGVVVILLIPAFLKSKFNTKVDIPPEERAKPRSTMQLVRYGLAAVFILLGLLDLGRIYHAPTIAHWAVIVLFLATYAFGRKTKTGDTPDQEQSPNA